MPTGCTGGSEQHRSDQHRRRCSASRRVEERRSGAACISRRGRPDALEPDVVDGEVVSAWGCGGAWPGSRVGGEAEREQGCGGGLAAWLGAHVEKRVGGDGGRRHGSKGGDGKWWGRID